MKLNWAKMTLKEFAGIVSKELVDNGIKAILVGGACVSIYSNNKYESLDLDYISYASTEQIEEVLKKLGFYKKGKIRHFINDECQYFIEFPPGPVAIGKEGPITEFATIDSITLLNATDCVKDRLAAYYYWDDEESLKQALLVAKARKVNLKEIERWSVNEGRKDKYNRFESLINKK